MISIAGLTKIYHRVARLLGALTFVSVVLVASNMAAEQEAKLHAFASIPPLAFFAEQVGGDVVDVEVLLAPGQSPQTYEPTAQQMMQLAEADLFISIGVPFEKKMEKAFSEIFENLTILSLMEGIPLKILPRREGGGASQRESLDPHSWLDPRYAKAHARRICEVLIEMRPEHTDTFKANLEDFKRQADSVEAIVREMLKPYAGGMIWTYHPAFRYYTEAFGLRQEFVENAGCSPTAKMMTNLLKWAKQDNVRVLFVQPEITGDEVNTIANEVGAEIVVLDPLSGDYFNNLVDMASKMAAALSLPEQERE